MQQIKIGYEIGTGKKIFINPSHLIVTGITQQSGKTTTLEALILRSEAKAIIFKTKIGEKSFSSGTVVPPFFRDRSDYEFVRSLIEAYSKEKLMIEKGTLMQLCKGSKSLIDIKQRVDDEISLGKLRGLKEEIYVRLQHYLENLIPQIQYANFSSTLNIVDGINIMDLERFSDEAQSLIIRSVADEVLKTCKDTIIIIPEAWKFIPQRYNNPCKQAVESFIRQGATNNNFIWIDSQDMSGVDKTPLKQISTWILGYQAERNEVKHTLDQISLPKKSKPQEDDIMNLAIGHFFLSSREQVVKLYVQPSWLIDEDSVAIATGNKELSDIITKKPLPSLNLPISNQPASNPSPNNNAFATKKEVAQMRSDFFNKLELMVVDVNNFLSNIKPAVGIEVDEESIAALVLQKMPLQKTGVTQPVDIENIITEVIKRIPKTAGTVTYEVAPLEKIKQDFLVEIKNKITADLNSTSADMKKALRYIEAKESDVTPNEIVTQCFMLKQGGSSSTKISNIFKELVSIEVIEKTAGGRYRKGLKNRIAKLMSNHTADNSEIENTYNHLLAGII